MKHFRLPHLTVEISSGFADWIVNAVLDCAFTSFVSIVMVRDRVSVSTASSGGTDISLSRKMRT